VEAQVKCQIENENEGELANVAGPRLTQLPMVYLAFIWEMASKMLKWCVCVCIYNHKYNKLSCHR